jgi:predicted AlkP superfamily pyrophosphatase or phosphodiesterase
MAKFLWLVLVAIGVVHAAEPKARVVVLVIDGLRPDMIRPDIMPNLTKLKAEGAWCANSHSVFPTVTRVNSASISTGSWPSIHGIVSNSMWVDAVSPRPFDTADYKNLLKLAEVSGGRAIPVPTLAETLDKAGIRFGVVSSGSNGSAYLLNPSVTNGVGFLVSPKLDGRIAYPDAMNQELQQRFGSQKVEAGVPSLLWVEKILREYVLPEAKPGVLIDWMTEPDDTQHRYGVGSPEALAALKADDEQIGLLIPMLRAGNINLIVTADHGFAAEPDSIDLNGALAAAGVDKDVIVASNGSSALIYAKNHDAAVVQKTVEVLQKTDGVDVLFTSAAKPASGAVRCADGKEQGWVAGTFALELIHECRAERGADVIVTFQWSSEKNEFGFPGIQKIANNDKRTGVKGRSGHGGLNPWMVHTPLLFWGPAFRKKIEIQTPTANYDIAPTILALEGITPPASMRGRNIGEASGGATPATKSRTVRAQSGSFCSELQLTGSYVDQGQRCK